jgi:hypothetical protein
MKQRHRIQCIKARTYPSYIRAIEAKLKEKNHG